MLRYLFKVVCCMIALSLATDGRAKDHPVERVASALTLADLGRATENADLILSGLEMLFAQDVEAGKAVDLLATLQSEAQFLIRGDAALAARLQQLRNRAASTGASHLFLLEPAGSFSVPDGFVISAFRSFSGLGPSDVLSPAVTGCVRNRRLW
ncbi:MAG: hypothetical protein AAF754_09915, partial [Pseudomonadota bacterium]